MFLGLYLKLDAFKLTQSGNRGVANIYITVFRAGDLVYRCKIDRRTPSNPAGYQRGCPVNEDSA